MSLKAFKLKKQDLQCFFRVLKSLLAFLQSFESFEFVDWWIRGFRFFWCHRLIYFFVYRNVAQIYFWPKLSTQKFTCFNWYLIELGHFIASSHMPFAIQGSAVHLKNWLPTCSPLCRSNVLTYFWFLIKFVNVLKS